MNETFIKHAENDIDGNERSEDEQWLGGELCLKYLRSAGKISANGRGHSQFFRRALDDLRRFA